MLVLADFFLALNLVIASILNCVFKMAESAVGFFNPVTENYSRFS